MVKFMLILQMCTVGICTNPVSDNLHYNSFKECAINGYNRSIDFMNTIDENTANIQKPVVRFWCKEVEVSNA